MDKYKYIESISFLLFLSFLTLYSQAQRKVSGEDEQKKEEENFRYSKPVKKDRYNIAILTPMYLDSTDWDKNLTNIPRFMMPGIDFYQGVQIAADTLKAQGFKLNIYIFDSKSNFVNVKNLIRNQELDSMDLIIGNASVGDLKLLAEWARNKQINFVSAVSPSDASQENNPFFTILQPRLSTHVEKIHYSINRKFPEDNVIFINRNIPAEKNALHYFKNDYLNPLPGRFSNYEMTNDDLVIEDIIGKIDSHYKTTIVLGILDAGTTYKVLKKLNPISKRFNLKVYCMPTTEAIKSLNKTDEFPDMQVFYTTSYIIDKITPASMYISNEYRKRMGSAPTDIVYKGFESLYFFAHLMKKYGNPFNEHLGDNTYSFITPYKIVPVKNKRIIQFYENKFLYLVKYENGIVTYE